MKENILIDAGGNMLARMPKGRGFLLSFALAAMVAMTATRAAVASTLGSNLSIQSIALSTGSTTLAYVTFTASLTSSSCTIPPGGQGANRMFFDFTTTRGKAIMSLLTAAQLAGKKVTLMGNNVCISQQVAPFEPNTVAESINWLRVE